MKPSLCFSHELPMHSPAHLWMAASQHLPSVGTTVCQSVPAPCTEKFPEERHPG